MAIKSFINILEVIPRNALMLVNLGIAELGYGHIDDAIKNFSKAVSVDPYFAEAHYNLGNSLRDKASWMKH